MKTHTPHIPLAMIGLAICFASPSQGALIFYENFSGYDAATTIGTEESLNGQGGWSSPGDSMTVRNGNFNDGQGTGQGTWDGTLTGSSTAGGNFITPVRVNQPNDQPGTQGFAHITLDTFVTSTFVADATTWLSYVVYNGHNGSAARHNLAIGAAPMTDTAGISMAGDGIGVGSGGNNQPFAAYWTEDDGKVISGTGAGAGRPFLVVAKIEWSDIGNDTITVARFTNITGLTETVFNSAVHSTISADLDQSTFTTLSLNSEYGWFNDIRIATDFQSAITGIPEPTTALLGGLGLLALLRRRR